jgi:hypothetical protein
MGVVPDTIGAAQLRDHPGEIDQPDTGLPEFAGMASALIAGLVYLFGRDCDPPDNSLFTDSHIISPGTFGTGTTLEGG